MSPNQTAKTDIKKEIKNKTTFPMLEILVFLIPYVIPMPRESMLLESAKNNELINIKTPPGLSYVEKRNLLKCHKQSTSHIEFTEREKACPNVVNIKYLRL